MVTAPEIIEVPPDKLPTVVTCLQMLQRPIKCDLIERPDFHLASHPTPNLDWYLELYQHVGASWLWSWRLALRRDELLHILHDPRVEVFSLVCRGSEEGLLELDFRTDRECELKLLGVSPSLVGKGAGHWLMRHALHMAWSKAIDRLWVHTCSMDHPDALDFYIRAGFSPYRRYIEIAADPRLIGLLPIGSGPHVPLLESHGDAAA